MEIDSFDAFDSKVATSNSLKTNQTFWERWKLPIYIITLFLVLIVFNCFDSILPAIDDVKEYFTDAINFLGGQLPYRDFQLEYPPLALLFFVAPAWLLSWFGPVTFDVYLMFFHGECVVLAAGTLWLISLIWPKIYPQASLKSWYYHFGLYVSGCFFFCFFLMQRFDIGAAFITTLAIYAFIREKPTITGTLLAIGTWVKLYPAIILPVLLIYLWQTRRDWRNALRLAISFGVVNLLLLGITLVFVPLQYLTTFLSYQSDRGVQTESLYASVIAIVRTLGFTTAKVVHNYGSFNFDGPLSPPLAALSTLLIVVGSLALYGLAWWYFGKIRNAGELNKILQISALVILWFILANKVLSPQYLIWLLPFVPFWRGFKSWGFVLILIVSFLPFPFSLGDLILFEPFPYIVLIIRNSLLILLFVQLLREFSRQPLPE